MALPPPVPPPLIPNIGPRDGSRIVTAEFLPILARPWVKPIAVVVLPSHAGVGLTPVTTTNLLLGSEVIESNDTFALVAP